MDYQNASEKRKAKLSDLISEKMLEGSTFGEGIKSSIKEKISAKATGLAEKFDPLNFVRFATGNSKLATSLAGKAMGRSAESISYFMGEGDTLDAKSSIADALDPLRLINKITGSSLITTIAGKAMGRSKEDILRFSGKDDERLSKKGDLKTVFQKFRIYDRLIKEHGKRLAILENPKDGTGSKNPTVTKIGPGRVTPVRRNDSIADVLAKIYNFMLKESDDKLKDEELKRDFEQEKIEEEQRRHDELVKAILDFLGKKDINSEEKPKEEKEGFLGKLMEWGKDLASLLSGLFSKLAAFLAGLTALLSIFDRLKNKLPDLGGRRPKLPTPGETPQETPKPSSEPQTGEAPKETPKPSSEPQTGETPTPKKEKGSEKPKNEKPPAKMDKKEAEPPKPPATAVKESPVKSKSSSIAEKLLKILKHPKIAAILQYGKFIGAASSFASIANAAIDLDAAKTAKDTGQLSEEEFDRVVKETLALVAGSFAGGELGAVLGGAAGTAVTPVLGTAIGAMGGGLLGSVAGGEIAKLAVDKVYDYPSVLDDLYNRINSSSVEAPKEETPPVAPTAVPEASSPVTPTPMTPASDNKISEHIDTRTTDTPKPTTEHIESPGIETPKPAETTTDVAPTEKNTMMMSPLDIVTRIQEQQKASAEKIATSLDSMLKLQLPKMETEESVKASQPKVANIVNNNPVNMGQDEFTDITPVDCRNNNKSINRSGYEFACPI